MNTHEHEEPSLGVFLRQEREARGITIEQVASATKVGTRTLYLLEADQYADLPAKPFVRGFVISYCRFIGLSPQQVLENFDGYIQKKSLERPKKDSGHSGYAFDRKDGDVQSRTYLMIAMISFLVLGIGVILVFKPSFIHKKRSHVEKLKAASVGSIGKAPVSPLLTVPPLVPSPPVPLSSSPVEGPLVGEAKPQLIQAPPSLPKNAVQPSPVPLIVKKEVVLDSPSEEKKMKEKEPGRLLQGGENPKDPLDSGLELKPNEIRYRLVLKMLETVWVRYQLDDRPMRKFLVRKGNLLILRAAQKIHFQVSNPHSVSMSYNRQGDQPLKKHADLFFIGKTATLVYPKELPHDFFKQEPPLPETPPPSSE